MATNRNPEFLKEQIKKLETELRQTRKKLERCEKALEKCRKQKKSSGGRSRKRSNSNENNNVVMLAPGEEDPGDPFSQKNILSGRRQRKKRILPPEEVNIVLVNKAVEQQRLQIDDILENELDAFQAQEILLIDDDSVIDIEQRNKAQLQLDGFANNTHQDGGYRSRIFGIDIRDVTKENVVGFINIIITAMNGIQEIVIDKKTGLAKINKKTGLKEKALIPKKIKNRNNPKYKTIEEIRDLINSIQVLEIGDIRTQLNEENKWEIAVNIEYDRDPNDPGAKLIKSEWRLLTEEEKPHYGIGDGNISEEDSDDETKEDPGDETKEDSGDEEFNVEEEEESSTDEDSDTESTTTTLSLDGNASDFKNKLKF